jgi:hypothetical protein
MMKNSTVKFWDLYLREEYPPFDRSVQKILFQRELEPRKKTINNILSYASSVKGIRMNSMNTILISLN